MSIAPSVAQYLDKKAITYQVKQHNPTASTLETADAAHVPSYTIAKGILAKKGRAYVLVVIPGDRVLDLDLLNYESDDHFELAKEEELQQVFTDCAAGAVPAIGAAYELETIVDDAVPEGQGVYFEGGDHRQLIYVSAPDFQTLIADAIRLPVTRGFDD